MTERWPYLALCSRNPRPFVAKRPGFVRMMGADSRKRSVRHPGRWNGFQVISQRAWIRLGHHPFLGSAPLTMPKAGERCQSGFSSQILSVRRDHARPASSHRKNPVKGWRYGEATASQHPSTPPCVADAPWGSFSKRCACAAQAVSLEPSTLNHHCKTGAPRRNAAPLFQIGSSSFRRYFEGLWALFTYAAIPVEKAAAPAADHFGPVSRWCHIAENRTWDGLHLLRFGRGLAQPEQGAGVASMVRW